MSNAKILPIRTREEKLNDAKTRRRLPTKTIYSLEDIMALCHTAHGHLKPAIKKAEQAMDVSILAALAKLSGDIAAIERIARKARQGEYDDNETGDE